MQTKLNHFSKCIVKKKRTPAILNKHNEGFFLQLNYHLAQSEIFWRLIYSKHEKVLVLMSVREVKGKKSLLFSVLVSLYPRNR